MTVGTVKFFENSKGFGFIEVERDVFVHASRLLDGRHPGSRTLVAGQTVEFDIGPGRKGDEAQNVRVL